MQEDQNFPENTTTTERSRYSNCPHCGNELKIDFSLKLELKDVSIPILNNTQNNISDLTTEQYSVINRAKETGLFKIFTEIVRTVKTDQIPNSMERFFISFFRTLKQKPIPSFALNIFVNTYRSRIEFFSSQGIGIVTANGKIKEFVPVEKVRGKSIKTIGSSNFRSRMEANEEDLQAWRRINHGYVIDNTQQLDLIINACISQSENTLL